MTIEIVENKELKGTFNVIFEPELIKVLALRDYQIHDLKELFREIYEAGCRQNGLIIKEEVK